MQSHIHRPSQASFSATVPNSSRKGFTLIELLVVITIIGILISVILVASLDGVRSANLKATQSLILKLDFAIKERLQALLDDEVIPNNTHIWLATPYSNKLGFSQSGVMRSLSPGRAGNARAKAIGMTDYLRAEMPDVFVLDIDFNNVNYAKLFYPLNFAGIPISGSGASVKVPQDFSPYILPIGNAISFMVTDPKSPPRITGSFDPPTSEPFYTEYVNTYNYTGTGIKGASYTAAAGIYKQLGYAPSGYDGVDNNGNFLVDEFSEGINDQMKDYPDRLAQFNLLANHKHNTARSEMLYALLVEGQGPLGSAFSRDDFTDREIQDTDGDGLLEFVDAWGEPLQFYRWPIWNSSDNQNGWYEYSGVGRLRDRDPIDPSSSLVSLEWWADLTTPAPMIGSSEKLIYETLFHRITESSKTILADSSVSNQRAWDGIAASRRAYRFNPLIVSSGPDTKLGIRQWGQIDIDQPTQNPSIEFLINYENLGIVIDARSTSDPDLLRQLYWISGIPINTNLEDDLLSASGDDISSHTLQQGQGGGAR